jgi:SsrA-binding protein
MCAKPTGIKIIAANRKARHYYELLDFIEAGIMLTGSEVKSLRDGKVNFMDGYVRISDRRSLSVRRAHLHLRQRRICAA